MSREVKRFATLCGGCFLASLVLAVCVVPRLSSTTALIGLAIYLGVFGLVVVATKPSQYSIFR